MTNLSDELKYILNTISNNLSDIDRRMCGIEQGQETKIQADYQNRNPVTFTASSEFDAQVHMNAHAVYFMLMDLENYLRELIKYRDLTEDQYSIVEEIRDKYFELKAELPCAVQDY